MSLDIFLCLRYYPRQKFSNLRHRHVALPGVTRWHCFWQRGVCCRQHEAALIANSLSFSGGPQTSTTSCHGSRVHAISLVATTLDISVASIDNNGTDVSLDQLSCFHNCFYYVIFCSYFLLSNFKLSRKSGATTHNNYTLGHVCFFLRDLSTCIIHSMCKAVLRQRLTPQPNAIQITPSYG